MKITTNNHFRDIIYVFQLSECERKEFGYYSDEELEYSRFFKYKGHLFTLDDFLRTDGELAEKGWQGFSPDSCFSGVCIKFSSDHEKIIVGSFYS